MNDNLKTWADFNDSDFLTAERVTDDKQAFACVGVDTIQEEGKAPKLCLELESNEGKLKRKFALNKTNGKFLESAGIANPRECIGRIVYFTKVKVTNPSTKQIVDALRICKVEEAK